MASPKLVVTGVGFVSALGAGAGRSCAAARAGLVRLRGLDAVSVLDVSTGDLLPIAGHVAAGGIAQGFRGVGRSVELARLALVDLLGSLPAPPARPLPLVVGVGGAYYLEQAMRRDLASATQLPQPPATYIAAEVAAFRQGFEQALVPRLGAALGGVLDSKASRVLFGEQAAFGAVLSHASELLSTGRVPAVVVGGVDSLVDEARVLQLFELGLIKTPTADAGFFPGEAAAFVLLERADSAAAARRPVRAILEGTAFRAGAPDRLAEPLPVGAEVAAVVSGAAAAGGGPAGLVLNSLNGDRWVAWDWGHAVPRLERSIAGLPQWQIAESFGEIGAAAMAAMTCVATTAFERGYAGAERVLLCGIGNDGGRAAAVLGRAS